MSKHTHHNCDCKHSDVKYCSTCRIVHCLDCNQEWSPKVNWTYTYTQPWYQTIGGLGQQYTNGQNWNSVLERSADVTPLDTTLTTTCNHKA